VAFNSIAIDVASAKLESAPVGDGQWVHVALTVDGDRNLNLYLNGVLQDTFQKTFGEPEYMQGSIVIGNNWKWARNPNAFSATGFKAGFNGCIDEIRIIGRTLLALEIEHIYGSGVAGTCPLEELANAAPGVDGGSG